MKPRMAKSLDAGAAHVVSYFLNADGICQLTLMIAEGAGPDGAFRSRDASATDGRTGPHGAFRRRRRQFLALHLPGAGRGDERDEDRSGRFFAGGRVAAPHSCRAGVGRSGGLRAVAGEPPPEARASLSDAQRALGNFLACVCRPKTPRALGDIAVNGRETERADAQPLSSITQSRPIRRPSVLSRLASRSLHRSARGSVSASLPFLARKGAWGRTRAIEAERR